MGRRDRAQPRFTRPEKIAPHADWKALPGVLTPILVLGVLRVDPPMVEFSGERITVPNLFGEERALERLLVYADAVVPA